VLDPLVGDMRSVIAGLEATRRSEGATGESARLQLEELELRRAIGELDDEAFDLEASDAQGVLATTSDRATAIGAELEEVSGILARWLDRRPELAEAPDVQLEEEEEDDGVALESEEEDEEDVLIGAGEDDLRGDGIHAETASVADDVSVVFDPPAREQSASQPVFAEPEEVAPAIEAAGADTADDGVGRPVLILAEGTPDEVINHFDGDALSIGRGRDNNVQVKNDSKVSRYHCRLYRKGGSYFVVDNKSANGTLVDNDLITEKRLFGGEEIIIGETPFRFRVLH
jgi:hypothetical protein